MTAHGVERPRLLLRITFGRELHADRRQKRGVQIADYGIEFVYLVKVRGVMDFQTLVAFQATPQLFLLSQPISAQIPDAVVRRAKEGAV